MEKSYVFKQPGNLSTLRSAQSQSNPYSYEENMQGIPQNLLLNRDYDELNSQYLSTFSMVQHRQLIKQQCRLGGATAFLDIYLMSYVVVITIKLLTLINKTRQELRGCLWMLHFSVILHYLPAKQAESNWTSLVIGWDQHWHLQEVSDITKSAVADFHDTNSIVYYCFAHSSIPHFNQFSSYSRVKNWLNMPLCTTH